GHDYSAFAGVIAPGRINLQTQIFDPLGRFLTENLRTLLNVDVFVMAGFGFGGGRENWFRQLRAKLQTRRQFDSANALRFLIFFPTGTGEITADDALDRQRLRFLHNHRTAGELLAKWPQLFGKVIEIGRNKVIVDRAEPVEPERRKLI